jgi:methanogenic corrinoid protein MtbC1
MADDDIDLASLSDEDLVGQMHDDLYDGLKEEIEEGVHILLDRGWTPYDVLTKALVEGMRIVGEDFRDGILFVPEVLLSANAMKAGMFILGRCSRRPARRRSARWSSAREGRHPRHRQEPRRHDDGGRRVRGHQHRINNPVEKYLTAMEEHKPDIVGMSALLTTTMPYMKVVIDTMKEKGSRRLHRARRRRALERGVRQAVGADAYCRDAAIAVETAKDLIRRRHNRPPVSAQVA